MIFDDKSEGIMTSGKALIYYKTIKTDELIFKATYYVIGDIVCSGKISALFDLIVIGNVFANDVNIKGKFVCTGKCKIENTIIVQNDIWADSLEADHVICHENCLAQEIDAKDVNVEGNITVGKAFGIEGIAQCNQRIICGETIYGAGKVITDMVITGDPIDLDEGEESLTSPNTYYPKKGQSDTPLSSTPNDCIKKYTGFSDYEAFLKDIIQKGEPEEKEKAQHYLMILDKANIIASSKMNELHDARILLNLLELDNCSWFEGCSIVQSLKAQFLNHFESFAKGIFPYTAAPQHPKDLNAGDYVNHIKYGKGKVTEKTKAEAGYTVSISFDTYGTKKFAIPNSLEKFTIIKTDNKITDDNHDTTIVCYVSGYNDWLDCLKIMYQNAQLLSLTLYNAIYEDLMSNLGLKAKYIADRFSEKGWDHYGK